MTLLKVFHQKIKQKEMKPCWWNVEYREGPEKPEEKINRSKN